MIEAASTTYLVTLVRIGKDRHNGVAGAVNSHPVPREIQIEVIAVNAVEAQRIAAINNPGFKAKAVEKA